MKSSTVNSSASIIALLVIGIILLQATTYAAPHPARYYLGYYSPMSMEGANPEYLLQTIARLRQALNADELEKYVADQSAIEKLGNDYFSGDNVSHLFKRAGKRAPKRQMDLGTFRGPTDLQNEKLHEIETLKYFG
ncbi:unnamed protein product [Brassicogethes aeneus]|uniref:Uncharacterized protein n=1 Tax=Brassicogethes aeneus TaxID=1431903 RepID=A0A9P0BC08_BRAAE|nr:unnamed protein product [Brassicogethes aeneus]